MKTIETTATEETETPTYEPAIMALAQHLDCDPADISEESYDHYGLTLFSAEGNEYAVGTDEEADSACSGNIKDALWAFNASFILSECDLPHELEDAIKAFQEDKCEGANDAILALVEKCATLESFVQAAISADGRGHFLSSYDGNENEETVNGETFYIYRTN